MKKVLFMALAIFFATCMSAECNVVRGNHVTMGYSTKGSTHAGGAKSPIPSWCIDLDDYVITMDATPCDYTLNLYDEDGEVVYSVFVPAGTTMIVLPSTLSGSFELRFETDTYYYYGYISL